jgi:hypothetical protein
LLANRLFDTPAADEETANCGRAQLHCNLRLFSLGSPDEFRGKTSAPRTDVLHRTPQASMNAVAQRVPQTAVENAAAGINGLKKLLMIDRLALHV